MSPPAALSEEILAIREQFFSDPVGFRPELALSGKLDGFILQAWNEDRSHLGMDGFAAMAVGGYGRGTLHPQSDLDLLVFFEDEVVEETVRRLLTPVWDLGFRVGHQIRQASDFERFDPEQMESYTAFMDARFLFGDSAVADTFRNRLLPEFIDRNRGRILEALVEMKDRRYSGFGNTVFQLEPDVKAAPGGLRDHQWVQWTRRALAEPPDRSLDDPVSLLYRIRNFLHFMSGRDQNILSYEYQEQVADRLGYRDSPSESGAEHLMRDYFLSAQAVAVKARTLETVIVGVPDCYRVPAPPAGVGDCIDAFRGAHGAKLVLDPADLDAIGSVVARAAPEELSTGENGRLVLEMMRDRRGIAGVLRTMHEVGLLGGVFPEFEGIRCRVIRDYFHKYTVDEHSLIAVGNIEALDSGSDGRSPGHGLKRVLDELERPELLLLSLLLHDIGKSSRHKEGDHACSSVEMLEDVLERLSLPRLERDRVRKVIRNHLEMSKIIMRRDLTDPSIVEQFADLVGTQEDLRMLYLLTYADMKAVSPDVWTSWKADLLWQLYLSTFEYLRSGFVEQRVAPEETDRIIEAIEDQLTADETERDYRPFLDGFPKQYLSNVGPERIAGLVRKYLELSVDRPVVTDWSRNGELWEVVVMTADRPELFSRLTGALAAFGMNVVRADAFSNRIGVAVDVVSFEDPDLSLTKNPTELSRLDALVQDAITGVVAVDALLRRRSTSVVHGYDGRPHPSRIVFDRSSGKCTIMEIVASDNVGLLFNIARVVSALGCNIEVALVATEGQKAIDVFYLTLDGAPLGEEMEEILRNDLKAALDDGVGARV